MNLKNLWFVAASLLIIPLLLIAQGSKSAAPSATPAAPPAAPAKGPADAVKAFYAFHFGHNMGFTQSSLDAKKAWLSPELFGLLAAQLKKPVPKGETPLIEGDPFTDSEEYPKSFKVGDATVSATTASVPVSLVWPEETTNLTVNLVLLSGEWRLDDFIYSPNDTLRKLVAPAAPPAPAAAPPASAPAPKPKA